MDITNGEEVVERQIQAKFVTKLPPALRVVSSAFAIPAKLGRYGLSEVVNTLLGLGMRWFRFSGVWYFRLETWGILGFLSWGYLKVLNDCGGQRSRSHLIF